MSLPERSCDRLAAATIALVTVALLAVTLIAHRTPLLGAETDLIGDSAPAARALAAGRFTAETFQFRGPGYPLMLAAASRLSGGDEFLAARLLNVLASAGALAAAYMLMRAFMGPLVGLAVLLALASNPVFAGAAIEAGTDMPALAMALVATLLVTRGGGARACAAAGLLAGFAYLTRANMVFLAPAGIASLLLVRTDRRAALAYVAGVIVPVAAWWAVHGSVTGGLPHDRNFASVAYEVYGQEVGYERFWARTGDTFRSIADVIGYDPVRFAQHIARNALTRWLEDARRLMPIWIGAPALVGMLFAWRRRAGATALWLHFGLGYLVLTLVFYTPRFFLYLLPFYLSGTFGLLLASVERTRAAAARLAIAALLIIASAVVMVNESRTLLADPPDETRIAGEWLRTNGRGDGRVMARKPHVAYFARMVYVPIANAGAIGDFLDEARKARVDYLFVSAIETRLVPQLSVLADSGVSLPGLTQIAHRDLRPGHAFSLYRLGPRPAAGISFDDSLLAAIQRYAERRPGQAWPRTYLGAQLVAMGRHRDALVVLAEAQRLDPNEAMIVRLQVMAHYGLGEHDQAALACERALTLVPNGAWEWGYMGQIRLAQARYAEARDAFRRAMEAAPADGRYAAWAALADSLAGAQRPRR